MVKKNKEKKKKKHIKIFILYCCSLVRVDLCDSLCTIFKNRVCYMPICRSGMMSCIGAIPPWCCCTDHILSPFLSPSLARSHFFFCFPFLFDRPTFAVRLNEAKIFPFPSPSNVHPNMSFCLFTRLFFVYTI